MKEAYHVLRLLSLDIVAGAVIGAAFFAELLNISIPTSTYLLLASVVWLVYTSDHILDSFKAREGGRHFFYFEHRKLLGISAVSLLLLACFLATQQPFPLVRNGLFLGLLVAFHILGAARSTFFKKYLKEFSCALLYTLGIALPAYSSIPNLDISFITASLFYLGSAWINLLTISLYEAHYDRESGFGSLVVTIGSRITFRMVVFLLIFSVGLTLIAALMLDFSILLVSILSMMIFLQSLILLLVKVFSINERYRAIGDLVYFLPLVTLV